MADIGYGYGSEWHLLRYLGRHRKELDRAILSQTGGETIDWLDFEFDPKARFGDREIRGADFLPADHPAHEAWSRFWPTRGNAQNWDGVARLAKGGMREWLLIEAKANLQEIKSTCGADPDKAGYRKIVAALEETKRALGVDASRDWMDGYYQYANRLAVLNFLASQGISARLVFIYFTGDHNGALDCPADESGWEKALETQNRHLGITNRSPIYERVHRVFLPVRCGGNDSTLRELMAPFVGIIDSGIPDLPTNPNYMAEHGKDSLS